MRVKALYSVLSKRFSEGHILFVDSIALSEIKTKTAADIMMSLAKVEGFERVSSKKPTAAYIALPESNEILAKSFANLPGVTVGLAKELNAHSAMTYQTIVMVSPEAALEQLTAKMK